MPDIIHLLPDTVANQIAAGEVIQRPASVVKELVENAVDAGATLIQVVIEEAGKTLIQVVDNGCGMSPTDARLAFERHATSKIRQATDLFALRSMGFRGEALPSIAAVSQVELRTRSNGNELGTRLQIEGGKVQASEAINTPRGANFAVRNLFFNIPARRKFLKSDLTEMGNILSEFERLALAHPDVAFQIHRDGTLIYDLPATSFRGRITGLFGHRIDKQLLPVSVETDLGKITGYTGTPNSARRKRPHQFFFANNRFMRHPYFARAVQQAYERLVPEGEQVPFFLRIDVDPAQIDVNIHPTKTEIKFQDEQTLWQILLAAVREALGKYGGVPTIDFDTAEMPDIPLFMPEHTATATTSPSITTDPYYTPFASSEKTASTPPPASAPAAQQQAPKASLWKENAEETTAIEAAEFLQYHGRFIVTAIHSGLMLIDQHRAHVRILYDRYRKSLAAQKAPSQGLLFPQTMMLSPAEEAELEKLLADLLSLGFDLRKEDGNLSYNIYGVPAGTEGIDPEYLLRGILDDALSGNEEATDTIHHRLALALAKRTALPVGQALNANEMFSLLGELFTGNSPNFTPDGKPVLFTLSDEQISSFFDANQ